MNTKFSAMKCPCEHAICKSWFVTPVAAVQGVSFTKKQAYDVAAFLNGGGAKARRALRIAGSILDYIPGDAWEREATQKDRDTFNRLYDELNIREKTNEVHPRKAKRQMSKVRAARRPR